MSPQTLSIQSCIFHAKISGLKKNKKTSCIFGEVYEAENRYHEATSALHCPPLSLPPLCPLFSAHSPPPVHTEFVKWVFLGKIAVMVNYCCSSAHLKKITKFQLPLLLVLKVFEQTAPSGLYCGLNVLN